MIKAPINKFSRGMVYFGQLCGSAYFYTFEHFALAFRSRVKKLQKQRAANFIDAANNNQKPASSPHI